MLSYRSALVGVGLAYLVCAQATVLAAPEINAREMQAREAFAAGRYEQALDLFVKLYAEKLHPVYLRNIGRCYQNLGQADRAISSFREYLRKAKTVSAEERAEVQGYIDEMEQLKRKTAAAPEPAPPPVVTAPPPKAVPTAPEPAQAAGTLTVSAPPPRTESPPLYTRWWFWTIAGGVVAAGIIGAVVATRSGAAADPTCPMGTSCQ
jgi:hypothetical protein